MVFDLKINFNAVFDGVVQIVVGIAIEWKLFKIVDGIIKEFGKEWLLVDLIYIMNNELIFDVLEGIHERERRAYIGVL